MEGRISKGFLREKNIGRTVCIQTTYSQNRLKFCSPSQYIVSFPLLDASLKCPDVFEIIHHGTDADCIQIELGRRCRKLEVLTPLQFDLTSGQTPPWLYSACVLAFLAAESRYSCASVAWDKEADFFLIAV